MAMVAWMLGLLIVAGFGYATWRAYTQWEQRQRAAEERMASFVAQAKMPTPPPATTPSIPAPAPAAAPAAEAAQERLLFDAADKAAQAGEPVLAIQLYARLLARYPQSGLAGLARTAVAEQKKKLAKT
jgi:hypothetical protein